MFFHEKFRIACSNSDTLIWISVSSICILNDDQIKKVQPHSVQIRSFYFFTSEWFMFVKIIWKIVFILNHIDAVLLRSPESELLRLAMF